MVLSEIVLSRVDEALADKISTLSGTRIIDDYEIYFENAAQAEQARIYLAQSLAEYRMMLNPRKTSVVELPVPLEPSWKHNLSGRSFTGSAAVSRRLIRAAIDAAFQQRQVDPESRSITYLLAMFGSCRFDESAWPIVQSFALASLEHEENILPKAARLVLVAHAKGWTIDKVEIAAALNRIVLRHAPLNYGNSVAWAMWLLLQLSLGLEVGAAEAARAMDDPFVLTLWAEMVASGLIKERRLSVHIKTRMGPNAWNSSAWLLLYESVQNDWLGAKTHKDVLGSLKQSQYLAALNKRGVKFFERTKVPALWSSGTAPSSTQPDAHAWATMELGFWY